ncbi:MAG: FKBP-type peptidyl-prolyl cis-trans isomerase [Treponema sp.]|jgi:FKBP-type peptidyl-prolyl cis-trans isomerase FkpA|nr:FKBP-type peptidyl-prolyl cis-trans isomerase [Treponema sp.]
MNKNMFWGGFSVFLAAALSLLSFVSCKGASSGENEDASARDVSYALGMEFGRDLRQAGFEINYDEFMQGFKDTFEGRNTRLNSEEAAMKIQSAYLSAMEKQSGDLRQAEIDFLEENSRKEGIVTTESGLQYEVITEGSGPRPGAADTVRVNYEGTFIDGQIFDSSYERGEPVEFPLNGVIPGWSEGLQLMSEGSNYRLYIPSSLAYGSQGASGVIPPYSALIFTVELISILP